MNEGQHCYLSRLEDWFARNCNGDWEHTYGISIETLDNPGWEVRIELQDTYLLNERFETVANRIDETNWVHCSVSDGVFRGTGGIGKLQTVLRIFLEWAESQSSLQS